MPDPEHGSPGCDGEKVTFGKSPHKALPQKAVALVGALLTVFARMYNNTFVENAGFSPNFFRKSKEKDKFSLYRARITTIPNQ
ncbi:MAG: hypothetical protein ACAI35_04855 [Candidatus Methylacidiphilales bacterium]|nr:hypothetical protein [Candidatus Methylacidiphilales bacterium]